MAIRTVLDSLDGVDETLAGHYVEQDGAYVLDVEGIDSHPKVRGLASTLRKYKEVDPDAGSLKRKMAKLSELESFGTLERTPEEIREALSELEALKASGGNVDGKIEELRTSLQAAADKRVEAAKKAAEQSVAEKDAEIQNLQSFVEKLTIDNALDRALEKIEALPGTREAVKALLKQRNPKVVQEDGDYRGIFETDLGDLPVEDYVAKWSTTDEAAPFMPASGNQGSGAGGGKGGGGSSRANPFNPETRNMTEQMRLVRENPRLAQQLAAEAGVKLPKVA